MESRSTTVRTKVLPYDCGRPVTMSRAMGDQGRPGTAMRWISTGRHWRLWIKHAAHRQQQTLQNLFLLRATRTVGTARPRYGQLQAGRRGGTSGPIPGPDGGSHQTTGQKDWTRALLPLGCGMDAGQGIRFYVLDPWVERQGKERAGEEERPGEG